ncbi:MAG: hypothetical protein V1889_00915 [archaeon]
MIIGILLGISASISLTSLIIIITTATGLIKKNLATGAAIGTTTTISYASITLITSLIATFLLILILKKSIKDKSHPHLKHTI